MRLSTKALARLLWLSATAAIVSHANQPQHSAIAEPFRRGVTAYGDVLAQLSGNEISGYLSDELTLEENLMGWAERLSARVTAMASAFGDSEAGALRLVAEEDRRLQELFLDSTLLDSSLANTEREVRGLRAQIAGRRRQITDARRDLETAEMSLNSHERALAEAERLEKKAKDKCISGRRRRRRAAEAGDSVPEEEEEEAEAEFLVAEEEAAQREEAEGGDSESIPERVKRGFFSSLLSDLTKPFEKLGKEIEKGLCRAVGELTGRIRSLRRLRQRAQGSRDAARRRLNTRRRQLRSLQGQLARSNRQLRENRARRSRLREEQRRLRADITRVGGVAKELKDASVFLSSLLVTGEVLSEVVSSVFVLDVETLTAPLNRAADLLTDELQTENLPHVPTPTPAQLERIRDNLRVFEANLGRFPLILTGGGATV